MVERRAEEGERDLRLITDALPVLISFIGPRPTTWGAIA